MRGVLTGLVLAALACSCLLESTGGSGANSDTMDDWGKTFPDLLHSICLTSSEDSLVVDIEVQFFHSVDAGCEAVVESSCEASFDFTRVEIETDAVLLMSPGGFGCDGEREPLTASCRIKLPEGSWPVHAVVHQVQTGSGSVVVGEETQTSCLTFNDAETS